MLERNEVNSNAYQTHPIFNVIRQMMDFYNGVSDTCYSYVASGAPGIGNYASYVYLSLQYTLDSIKILLMEGHITDAFVLSRKYFDTVLVEIYIDVVRRDKYDWMESFIVKDVEEWIKGHYRIPTIKKILGILKTSESTKDLFPYFGWNTYLKNNREFLDDSVHVNRYYGLLMNCPQICLKDREKQLNNISIILNQVFLIHISFIFHLNGHYLMASDYVDSLELGLTPPEGSERWIAQYAQRAFNIFIKPHEKLASFIKDSCQLDID